jgi:AcrR family transcriptional regulator
MAPAKKKATDEAPRQTLRERQRTLTREALLAGATEAFAQAGYNDVTIDDIAARAGTSRGTFYLYFSKGSILAELIENAFLASIGGDAYSALFADLTSVAPYTVERLEKWIRGYVSTWQKNKPLVRAWMEGDVTDPEVRELTQKRISRAVKVLSDLLMAEQHRLGLAPNSDLVRARASLMDLELQYFCFHVVVRDLSVNLNAGVRALAEQWFAAIHMGPDGTSVLAAS